MRAPQLPEPEWLCRSSHLDDAGGNPPHYGEIRNVPNNNGIRSNDDIVTNAYTAQDLGACTNIDAITDGGRAEGIRRATVSNCDTVTDQAVVPHHCRAMYDNTAVVLYAQAPTDGRGGANDDAAED